MVYFLKLHMGVYLRAKFEASSIILTSFRWGVILPPPNSKWTPKKPTQIRVKGLLPNEQNQQINMINATWQCFQFGTSSFFPKINSIKLSNSINKICNSTQLSKFLTKFYYKLFFSFWYSFFYQYCQFVEFICIDVCIV